jgi:hypothetical protein
VQGFGKFAQLGYKIVGQDQLIGGPFPDNFPSVTMLDWDSGQPNAKYYSVQMLAALGTGPKHLMPTNQSGSSNIFALGMVVEGEGRKLLVVSKSEHPQSVKLEGCSPLNAAALVLDGAGTAAGSSGLALELHTEPGFAPPTLRSLSADGLLALGGYGVALVSIKT